MKSTIAFLLVALLIVASAAFGAPVTKIAVAAVDKTPAAAVGEQPAPSPYFLMFDGQGKLLETVENPYRNNARGGPGVLDFLAGKGVTVVVAGWFGPQIESVARSKGMTAVSFKGTVADAVKKVLQAK